MRKKRWFYCLLFVFIAFIIIGYSAYQAMLGKDVWTSQQYGTTSDDVLSITGEKEIKVTFKISEDTFQGVFVKLKPDKKVFVNEKLHFYLVDRQTHRTIADNTLYLKNTYSQFNVFVSLPYEKSKDKDVELYITGEEIATVPELVISKNADLASKLYIDDELQSKRMLVFSGVYFKHQNMDYSPLMKGAVYMAVVILIFTYNEKRRKIKTKKVEKKNRRKILIEENSTAYKKIAGVLILSAVYAIMAIFVYKNNIQKIIEKKETISLSNNTQTTEALVLTSKNKEFSQSFEIEQDDLSSISYVVKTKNVSPAAKLDVIIQDADSDICYFKEKISLENLPKNKGKWHILLTKSVSFLDGRNIKIIIKPYNFGDSELVFFTAVPSAEMSVTVDNLKKGRYPILYTSYNDNDYLKKIYSVYAICLYMFILICCLFFIVFHVHSKKIIAFLVMILGMLYMLVIPIYSVPDEYTHMDTAYALSNRILGIDKPGDIYGMDYKRKCDIETEELLTYTTDKEDYRRLYTEWSFRIENEDLELCTMTNAISNANILFYLPSAIGISIGRIMRFGTIPMYMLGRFMNLMVFVLLCYAALQKMPGMRRAFVFYISLPIVLQQAASFSYDAVLMACAFIFIAYCLYNAVESAIMTTLDWAVILFTMVQLATVKGGTYLPLCLLSLIIPIEQKWKLKHGIYYAIACCGISGIAFSQNNLVRIFSGFFNSSSTKVNAFSGTEMYTLGFLINHPVKWVKLFINTFFSEGSRLLYELFGGKMGSVKNIQLPWMYIIIFIVLLVLIMQREEKNFEIKSRWTSIGMWFISIISILLISFSMLLADTKLDMDYISGIQGRYFIPFALLPIIAIISRIDQKRSTRDQQDTIFMLYYFVQVMFILNIIMIVIG